MTVQMERPTLAELAATPGAFADHRERVLPGLGVLEFEQAPAGWLLADGRPRYKDHRAYYFTPEPQECEPCGGTGRVEGKTAKGRKCPDCKGDGSIGRRTRLTSVTTLIGQITPKDGLPPWAEARGIEGAVEAARRGLIDPGDPASAAMAVDVVRANRLGADRARDEAADRGVSVHDLLEHYMHTGEPPNPAEHPAEHHGYLRALTRWLLAVDPEPVAVEEMVCDPEVGYAGRYDLAAKVHGELVLYDAKTQERGGVYPGAHLQLGLLRRGLRWCGDGDVDRLRVVAFAADGAFREMDALCDDHLVDAALTFARLLKPVTSACEAANRAEREARRAAA